ncbi:uncharacterized protein ACBR49_003622 [Aulostomus maculatus]
MMLQAAVLSFLLCSAHTSPVQDSFEKSEESSGNSIEDDDFSVSTLIEKANVNLGQNPDDPLVFGDIAMPTGLQNADPCTLRGCLWPKATDGNVYVPYRISNQYSSRETNAIVQGLRSFAQSTCIRFTPHNRQRDFVDIQSRGGCFSFIGRRGSGQVVSLSRQGCIFQHIIQHEMLHALGFNHEQTRSDRDQHVQILLQNVIRGMEFNFRRIQTRNLGTPYDYNSVMHYGRFAFSRNRQPTIIPVPNRNVAIGRATQMSRIDILRVNRLYNCNSTRRNSVPEQENFPPEIRVRQNGSHVSFQVLCSASAASVCLLLGRPREDAAEDQGELSVSELLERANRNLVRSDDGPALIEGDIAIDGDAERNADPCTSRSCKWGKWTDGKVYIPYSISGQFSSREKSIITRGLESFSSFSCIRFRPSRSSDRDWLSIESQDGCWSFVGRRGGKQVVSLARRGCLYHGTVQHELLHALGFNHEQTRSDRDNHIKVLLQNVQSGMEHNFRKIATLNQGTPYDYNSVMQYHRYAFSKNNQPTMVPIPNSNVSFGNAKEMSRNDIARLNTLYKCCECPPEHISSISQSSAPLSVDLNHSVLSTLSEEDCPDLLTDRPEEERLLVLTGHQTNAAELTQHTIN